MKKRELGHSGIEVPALCLGGNVFGWTADEARSFELLDALLESGLNFVDTADVIFALGSGESWWRVGDDPRQDGSRRGEIAAR